MNNPKQNWKLLINQLLNLLRSRNIDIAIFFFNLILLSKELYIYMNNIEQRKQTRAEEMRNKYAKATGLQVSMLKHK